MRSAGPEGSCRAVGADKRPMYGGEQHYAEHCGSQQNRQDSEQLPGPEGPEFNAKWAHFAAHIRCCPELLDPHYIVNREADSPPGLPWSQVKPAPISRRSLTH
jgi:hypothetical protein